MVLAGGLSLMPMANVRVTRPKVLAKLVSRIDAEFPLEAVSRSYHGETAARWRYRDGSGEIGVIYSVTAAFCGTCTRARLSTDGQLFTCLFATRGNDIRALLRDPATTDDDVTAALAGIWGGRADRYSEPSWVWWRL